MKHLAIIVDWFGPYSRAKAEEASKGFSDGLYLAIGRLRYQRLEELLYVGLSKKLSSRANKVDHAALSQITDIQLWLGEVSTSNRPGKKTKKTKPTLDLAEWVHAYFVNLPLNNKKTKKPPPTPVTVLNRWWKKDNETQWVKRPHEDWPDLIDFVGHDYSAKLVWFGNKVKRLRPPFRTRDEMLLI